MVLATAFGFGNVHRPHWIKEHIFLLRINMKEIKEECKKLIRKSRNSIDREIEERRT